jgi:hypothetical protein
MDAAMSMFDCCTKRDNSVLQRAISSDIDEEAWQRQAEQAKPATAADDVCYMQQQQQQAPIRVSLQIGATGFFSRKDSKTPSARESLLPLSTRRLLFGSHMFRRSTSNAAYFPMPPEYAAEIKLFEEPTMPLQTNDSFEHSSGALPAPTVSTQVDTPDVQEFRVTPADTSDKASADVEASLKKPKGPADNIVPRAICVEALLNGTDVHPPSAPRRGFRTISVDKEHVDTELAKDVGQLNSRGVPDPPLALPVPVPEELKGTAKCHATSSSSTAEAR